MTITINNFLILPETVIQAGIRGKNMRSNTRVMSGSGYAAVNINWARTLRQYELGIKPMEIAQWLEIEALHEATDGGATGFKMKDPKDHNASHSSGILAAWENGAEVPLVAGLAYGTEQYILKKRYSTIDAISTYTRRITRPEVFTGSGVEIKYAGSVYDPDEVGVSDSNGLVTFEPIASQVPSSITTGSSTILTFPDTTFTNLFSVNNRVFLQGITGTAATTLNNRSHLVNSKSANQLSISTITSGLTVINPGTARRYPQPGVGATLTWDGDFYVPVHFANDEIDWEVLVGGTYDNRVVAGPSVVLQEVRE
jgi:uncharacterized protein (TIGR02217 family)